MPERPGLGRGAPGPGGKQLWFRGSAGTLPERAAFARFQSPPRPCFSSRRSSISSPRMLPGGRRLERGCSGLSPGALCLFYLGISPEVGEGSPEAEGGLVERKSSSRPQWKAPEALGSIGNATSKHIFKKKEKIFGECRGGTFQLLLPPCIWKRQV